MPPENQPPDSSRRSHLSHSHPGTRLTQRTQHRPGGMKYETSNLMKKTNFDLYLEEQLRDPDFAERFKQAGEAWDVALQLTALREKAGLSQAELARKLKTTEQQISRRESPAYEGHSLSMLRRVASALHAQVRLVFEPLPEPEESSVVREEAATYKTTRRKAARK